MLDPKIRQLIDDKREDFFYLASPYTRYSGGHEKAFEEISAQAGFLLNECPGIILFGPISHSHPIAKYGNVEKTNHGIWLQMDVPFVRLSQGLILCKMDGWDKSDGVDFELEICRNMNKPVIWMEPGVVPKELEHYRR